MWDRPRPELEPVSPALAGRISTTAPPRKPALKLMLMKNLILSKLLLILTTYESQNILLILHKNVVFQALSNLSSDSQSQNDWSMVRFRSSNSYYWVLSYFVILPLFQRE